MKTVIYPNGYSCRYDDTLQVGDLVVTYNTGYHEITSIEDRPGQTPLIRYVKRFDINGKPSKRIKECCDASYVSRAKEPLKQEIETRQKSILALDSILKTLK